MILDLQLLQLYNMEGMGMRAEDLIESSSDGIFAFNYSYTLTTCNKKLRTLLRITKEAATNTQLFDTIDLLDNQIDRNNLDKVLMGDAAKRKGKIYYDKNNSTYIHFTLELSPVLDSNGSIVGGMGVLKEVEIYDNKDASLSTLTQANRANDNTLPKIVFDLNGKPICFNESYRQLWNITPKVEKYVYNHYNLFRDEQLLGYGLLSKLKNRMPEGSFEMPLLTYNTKKTAILRSLDVKQKTLSGYIHPQKNSDGEVNRIEVILIDLSNNINQGVYSDFYQKFQKLTKTLPVVIYEYVLHPDGVSYFRYISKNCSSIFGISDIEIQEDSTALKNLIHPDDLTGYLKSMKKAEANIEEWEWEGRFIVAEEVKWFRVAFRPEKEANGDIVRYGILTEMTAEKQALLNEGIIGKRLELAVKGGNLGLWDWDLTVQEINTNDRFHEIVGYTMKQVRGIGKSWIKRLHEDDQRIVYNEIIQHIKGKSDFFDLEVRVKTADNTWHWIQTRGQVTERDSNQRALRLMGTIQNIDIRKTNQQTLLESERRYRSLVEHSPLAITIHSEGKIVFANEQSGKLLGVESPQDLIGREVLDFIKKDHRELAHKRTLSIYKNKQAAPMMEETFVDINGKEVIAEVVGIPYQYDGKRAIQLIARDITEKKNTEGVLKRSERLLNQLFENVPIGIVLLDEKRRVIQINKGFEEIFGYNNDEVFGQKLKNLIIPKKLRGEAINITKLVTEGKVVKEVEALRETKEGRLIPVMIYGLPVKLKGKVIAVYGIYVDVTASKNVEAELKTRNEELDNFVYKVSHDLRAPLSSTLGLIHLAKLEGRDANLRQYVELIEDRINQLDRFITDVLSHSKNLKQEVVNSEIDFRQIIDISFENLNYLPGADIIHQEVTIDKCKFINDRWRVSEVMRNLISNAIKYLNPEIDNPYVKISIKITSETCEICFEDNGIGIVEELQPRVFEMFYRATEFSEGSGIGLYIVKNAIDKMGGSIKLESTQHEGTKFYISLPNK